LSRIGGLPIKSEFEAVAALDAALREAVALQAVADVPLGAFLSGGVDSSTIVALMQAQSSRPVQTFTVGFDEAGFDESPHAQAVAQHLGTVHHALRVTAADARAVIPQLPAMYDEPFADSSQIPTHLVCRAARQQVTVALSGDAGDELFGGYNRYFWGQRVWNRVGWMPPALRQGLGAGIQRLPVTAWDALGRALPGAHGIARLGDKAHKLAHRLKTVQSVDDLYRSLVTEWPQGADLVRGASRFPTKLDDAGLAAGVPEAEHRMMLWDTLTYLPDDILTKVDRAAMSVSLETRVPFLDHRVVELAWRLPLHMKVRDGQGKWVLRQVLYKYVPRELIERPKAGFGIPVGQWLRGPLRDWAEELLDEMRLEREGYFNVAPIRQVWQEHLSGRHDWTSRLWTILMFQAWLEGAR
jgi:asparagine synthase (glutamine-hydrolysing)